MEHKDYRLAAIMYTDIAGFSRMMEKDEANTLKVLSYHNALVTEIAERHHGTVIKTIGDAFLVDFRNTVEALKASLEIQDRLYAYNKENPGLPLLLRIGVHLGDIYFYENDALGEGINIAARLQSLAHPGAICFSQDVYNLVLNKLDFTATKLGKVSLKNITKEVHAYEISSPNVEFDPNRDKPRPGYTPESYGEGAAGKEPLKAPAPQANDAGRDYSPEGSANALTKVRREILAETKARGQRMTVREALDRYSAYGVEASEAIATLADQGIVIRDTPRAPTKAGFDGEALGRDIERAVSGIVDAIEFGIRKGADARRSPQGAAAANAYSGGFSEERLQAKLERHAVRMGMKFDAITERARLKAELKRGEEELETGNWDKELKDSDYFKPGTEELASDFAAYREGIEVRSRKTAAGLVGNILSYLGVNAALWYINLGMTVPGLSNIRGVVEGHNGLLWAAIVSAAWGTGVVANIFATFRNRAKVRDAARMPNLEGEALDAYKKLNRVKDSLVRHTASVLSVPPMLFVINMVTTALAPPWFVIPSGIMLISWISHLATYGITKRRLERKVFAALGVRSRGEAYKAAGSLRRAGQGAGPYASLLSEAAAARDAIVAQIKESGSDTPLDKDMIPSLDQYVEQVGLLAKTLNEIDAIVESVPMDNLAEDKRALSAKLDAAKSESLKAEYRSSIAEIEKQEASFRDLQDQREVLNLRLRSSVNSLKQMRLDLARFKTAPGASGAGVVELVRTRTDELAKYLEDVRRGYEEARGDPWEELERIAAEREAKARPALSAAPLADAPPADPIPNEAVQAPKRAAAPDPDEEKPRR